MLKRMMRILGVVKVEADEIAAVASQDTRGPGRQAYGLGEGAGYVDLYLQNRGAARLDISSQGEGGTISVHASKLAALSRAGLVKI